MTPPPSVGIVCRQADGLRGATGIVLETARRLVGAGWRARVYAERLDREALAAAGVEWRRLPGWPWGSYGKRRFFSALADWAAARGGHDLIHGHGDNLSQDVLSLHNCVEAAQEAVHGAPQGPLSGAARLHAEILRAGRFKKVIANSKLMAGELSGRFGVSQEKIRVIYPGFDPLRFKPDPSSRREARGGLGFSEEDFVFGLVTSGDFVKRGLRLFLEALALLRGRPFKALVVGKESRLGPYERLARESGAAVRFMPPVPDVERCYHALDVYVHPALYEEFGMSLQEAMACGLPAISGARVGAAELIGGEGRRFVLESLTPPELAARMAELAGSEAARRRLSELGPRWVSSNTWGRYSRETVQVYQEILENR
ncbi:MAG: glycosyltransferase family 4 protein [Elusimicrobia bacterium]|nr:glycosyltransferase family 4 protein [Elusimicrobiota bacterium]